MEAGASVWCSDIDGDDAWILGEVISRSDKEIKVRGTTGNKELITRNRLKSAKGEDVIELKYEGIELANAKLSEAEKAEGRDDDLITLPHLHEPALLHAVGERFESGKIYTWTGPVLIAVNPFERLPLYTNEILETYRREGLLRSQGMGGSTGPKLGPHIYSIADRSYRQMMSEKRHSQSILISGESGAGKTESTKIVMLYLTTLGTAHINDDGTGESGDLSIMERVLQSNPILEAFGNARTLRNDNSSRFGKFIELGFSRGGSLLGAKVQTYLLEKVRLAYHASGERNYHIFYQLLRGSTDDERKKYGFHEGETQGLELVNHCHYTGQGGAPQLREFTDEEGLNYTVKAMKSIGWDDAKKGKVMELIAGILHLGQINFNGVENEGGQEIAEIADTRSLCNAAKMLDVDEDMLRTALTERIMITRGDAIKIQLGPDKAADSRDALAKTIYGALFLWVVSEVNKSICWSDDSQVRSSTGVLDIFGFESFAVNSFEQLCINFTNEALQQQFNKFIFKMEQAEYENEKIEWAFIAFPDNQDCLDTIQSRPTGILAMLDDECRLGARGSDKNWADRLYKQFIPERNQVESENTRFSATPIQKSRSIFCVRHFAGVVQYSATTGFLEKNKDEIPVTAQNLFEKAPSWLIRDIYVLQKKETEDRAPAAKAGKPGKPARSKTVGQQFKEQLNDLITKVETTEPHYIRCLKPNDAAKPKMMTRKRLTEQLRYGGVLEAVRVARMGYPVRLNHVEFFRRYRMLLPSISEEKLPWSIEGRDVKNLCVRMLDVLLEEGAKDAAAGIRPHTEEGISMSEKIRRMQKIQPEPMTFPKSDVQLGLSKVFMRKPPYDVLESHRVFHQNSSITLLQSWARGMQKRISFIVLCEAALNAQRVYRGFKGRERWWRLREAVAGDLLTNVFRMLINWRRFNRAKQGTIRYQAVFRGYSTRRILATIKIQTQVRMQRRCKNYKMLKSATIALQCAQRCKKAKSILAALKHEQKDIGKLKQNNEKLKMEMASLKAMLAAQAKGSADKEEMDLAIRQKEDEIEKLEKRIAELESELEKQKAIVEALELEMAAQVAQSSIDSATIKDLEQKTTVLETENKKQSHRLQKLQILQQSKITPLPSSPVRQYPSKHGLSSTETVEESIAQTVSTVTVTEHVIDPEVLAEHKAHVARLEEELETERTYRREADSEILRLRAQIGGASMSDNEVDVLIVADIDTQNKIATEKVQSEFSTEEKYQPTADSKELKLSEEKNKDVAPTMVNLPPRTVKTAISETPLGSNDDETKKISRESVKPGVQSALDKGVKDARDKRVSSEEKVKESDRFDLMSSFMKSPTEYFPMIKRGFGTGGDTSADQQEVMAVGWNVEVTNRKEREEALRDQVHSFEIKQSKFYHSVEHGIEVTMWQMNKNTEVIPGQNALEFTLKSTPVTIKMHRRGDLLVQAVLTFTSKGGYLSKALGRRKVDRSALEPLSLHEILEVKAGCSGFDHMDLPSSSKKSSKNENKHVSLFLTIKASPTPMASTRCYFLKMKSRSARNDLLLGLRGVLSDLQIHEGINISTIETPHLPSGHFGKHGARRMPGSHTNEPQSKIPHPLANQEISVPLSQVHIAINKEREAYDRLLLMMLQGSSDLKDREDDLLLLRAKLDRVVSESKEKDKVQATDSKLIMQLSKKLETLLMDNEDLRDQNDRLNTRLVAVECEKMNLMGG